MENQSLETRGELFDRPGDEVAELLQRWNQRLSFSAAECVKGYVEGRLVLGIGLCSRSANQPERNFLIQFMRRSELVEAVNVDFASGDDDEPVFVDDVEIVQDFQGMVVYVPSGMVRLQALDDVHGRGADALYFSLRRRWVFGAFPEYGKLQIMGRGLCLIGEHELPDQMVERRAQLIENLSDYDHDSVRNGRTFDDHVTVECGSARIVVIGKRDGVTCFVDVSRNVNVQITDVFFGPFNLGSTAV